MCVVNGVRLTRAEFLEYLAIKKELKALQMELHRPAQYGFTYGDWPIIKPIEGRKDYEIVSMDWEFRPFWVKDMEEMKLIRAGIDPKTGKKGMPIPWLNAKAENLLTSKMWKPSALKRRCIVPTDYFFEWRHIFPIGKKGEPLKTSVKFPYAIKAKGEGKVYMAGIWTPWKDQSTGETKDTFAIVTTEANEVMRMIHNSKNRMPTFLSEEMAEAWLWGDLTEADVSVFGSNQWPSDQMEFHTVGKDFLKSEEPLTEVIHPELQEKPKDLFS
jgi:putative SOS response-associated peptidase YedK